MKFLVLLIVGLHVVLGRKLPPSFTVCSRNDPNLNQCFNQAAQKALALMTEPIPELSLPSIDPMKFDRVEIPPSNTDNFKFGQTLTDMELHNVKSTKFVKSHLDLKDTSFNLVIHTKTPWLKLQGNYQLDGKILLLVVRGEGTFTVFFDDIEAPMNLTGTVIEKKGKQHLHMTDISVKLIAKEIVFKFNNLFNGNQEVGDSINQLLNKNWRAIYEEIGSTYEEVVAEYLKGLVNQIFNKVPYEDLFPIN